jgi:hypothetical protein
MGRSSVSLLALGLLSGSALAQEQAPSPPVIQDPVPWWRTGVAQANWQSAEGFDMGGLSFLVPLHATLAPDASGSGTMFYTEPYGQWFEGGAYDSGLGFGFRHLRAGSSEDGGGTFFFGGNGFVHSANTWTGQDLNRFSLGVEAGTRRFDVRARRHFPGNDVTTTVRSVTRFEGTSESGGIQAEESLTFDTTATLLSESLRGWETDASWLVPGVDRWADLRVLAGYAAFESPSLAGYEVDSWRAGLEFRPLPAVSLSAIWHENEQLFGASWLYGVALEVPFEFGDPGSGSCAGPSGGRGWLSGLRTSFRSRARTPGGNRAPVAPGRFFATARPFPVPVQGTTATTVRGIEVKTTYVGTFTAPDGTTRTVRETATTSGSVGGASTTTVATYNGTFFTGPTMTAIPPPSGGDPIMGGVAIPPATGQSGIPGNTGGNSISQPASGNSGTGTGGGTLVIGSGLNLAPGATSNRLPLSLSPSP